MKKILLSILLFLLTPAISFASEPQNEQQRAFDVDPSSISDEKLKQMDMAIAKEQVEEPEKRIYSGAFMTDFGPIVRAGESEDKFTTMMGLFYRHKSFHPGHWEGGFEIIGDRLGGMTIGYRYIFDVDRAIRPQFKVSLASVPLEDQDPVDFFSTANMSVRVALGTDSSINDVLRFKFDGEAGFDKDMDLELRMRFGLLFELENNKWKRSKIKEPAPRVKDWQFEE